MGHTVSELRQIFGINLRLLLQRNQKTVVETCQEVGINRAQFNKYLSGASSPKPEVLLKLCNYFAVDARILLEPLHGQPAWSSSHALGDNIAQIVDDEPCRVDDRVLKPGFYRQWLVSHLKPGKIYNSLVLIKSGRSRTKTWKTRARATVLPSDMLMPDCSQLGVVFSQKHGFAVVNFANGGDPILFNYFKFGFNGDYRFCVGYSLAGHLDHYLHNLLSATFIERLPQTAKSILRAARETGYLAEKDAPYYARQILFK